MCTINRSSGLPYEQIPDRFNPVKDLAKKIPPRELLKRLKERNREPENGGTLDKPQGQESEEG